MKNLEALLKQAKVAYCNGKPFMSDQVYDRLESQVETFTIGAESSDNRYPHAYQMYSLQKVYEGDKYPYYDGKTVVVSPKLDGAAVSLQYVRGELTLALTRGDGKKGMDITDKMKFLVPCGFFIDEPNETKIMQITGEVVAPTTIENARNYASGALNLKDIEEFKSRDLTFIAYGVQPYPTNDILKICKNSPTGDLKHVLIVIILCFHKTEMSGELLRMTILKKLVILLTTLVEHLQRRKDRKE